MSDEQKSNELKNISIHGNVTHFYPIEVNAHTRDAVEALAEAAKANAEAINAIAKALTPPESKNVGINIGNEL